MKNISANPLDYVEGGALNARRVEISAWLDATNPDLSAFVRRGGKMIVAIGTNDSLASPGAQLDYYQSVIDKMGRSTVDGFARFYVLPQTGHGLTGSSYTTNGDGGAIPATQIPSRFDRVTMLLDWVEKGVAPPKSATATGNTGTLPLCSYPTYPRYNSGAPTEAASYTCAEK
jgi:feruloyl esterase